jgi:hypothetical protein
MTEPCNWTVTANGIIIEDWTPFGLPLSSSASSLASLDSTSSACSIKKEMKDKETQTDSGDVPSPYPYGGTAHASQTHTPLSGR